MHAKTKTDEYLIVANGPLYAKTLIAEIAQNKTIIALDGAANKLAKLGILPDIILGDLDSIDNKDVWGITATFNQLREDAQPYVGKYGVLIVPVRNQNATDLTKGIRYCDEKKAQSIHIIGTIGGSRIDHTIGSLRCLRSNYRAHRKIYLHTESHTLTFACYETLSIRGQPTDNCAIISFPTAIFSSTGLKYNGQRFPLNFGFSESTCNELSATTAEVEICGEALIIHPGFFSAQREFSALDDVAKLQLLFKESNWHLLELTVKEFKQIKQLRQQVKLIAGIKVYTDFCQATREMNISQQQSKIIYVSATKQDMLESADEQQKILLSVTPEKLHTLNFFRSHLTQSVTSKTLHDMAAELYPQQHKNIRSRL